MNWIKMKKEHLLAAPLKSQTPSLVLTYLLNYMAATGQYILLSCELCSNVGIPGGDFQASVTILGQTIIPQFIPLARHSKT